MQKKRRWKIIAGCVLAAAAIAVAVICWTNREGHPVRNEVRVDGTVIRAGQPWEEMQESLEKTGLTSEVIRGFVPRRDGVMTGLNIHPTITEKTERVKVIYYTVDENETDCVIELAGIPLDQGTYEDVLKIAGPEDHKIERETITIYIWIDRDKGLWLRTDKAGKIVDFDLYHDRRGFKDRIASWEDTGSGS
jgi:hypothetical protein